MRTFPKSLASFRNIVKQRGEQLRQLSFEELRNLARPFSEGEVERLTVESRPATIGIIGERSPSASGQTRRVGRLLQTPG